MADNHFLFLTASQLPQFKQGLIRFDSWTSLKDPFLDNRRVYQPPNLVEPMSDSEFADALKGHYDAMDEAMRNMVEWEYYLAQAKKNREKIEQQLQKPTKKDTSHFPDPKHYQGVCCLRLFTGIFQDALWQQHGQQHQGFAVLLDSHHEFFTSPSYGGQPQMFRAISYDDTRPPKPTKSQPFPALFQRANHWQFEQEWRLLRPKGAADKEDTLFKIPKGLIKGVYLGMNVPKSLVQDFRKLVKMDLNFRHVDIHHMGVSEEYLRLVPMQITDL